MKRPHPIFALLVVALVAALLSGFAAGSAVAAPVVVTPDVANLPVGTLPQLPYVDVPGRQVVDGTRHVSISGLQGTVTALHKVDGGYILARTFSGGEDLVMVRTSGARKVLVAHWMNRCTCNLDPDLAVSHDGSKVAVNVSTAKDQYTYTETRVVSLPAGNVLYRKKFPYNIVLLGYGTKRVLVGQYPGTRWWTPSTGKAPVVVADEIGVSADLTAWQWAAHGNGLQVMGIPPDSRPSWSTEEDHQFGRWSLDDTMIASTGELGGFSGQDQTDSYIVQRASDGAGILAVLVPAHADINWETNSTLLMATRIGETPNYQLIRCNVAGSCQKVGPTSTSKYGALIPATRRNS
jgi:hypothetical protein